MGEIEREVKAIIDGTDDLTGVILDAITYIVGGKIVQYFISVNGPVNCGSDPNLDVEFGERLLRAAIDKLQCPRDRLHSRD